MLRIFWEIEGCDDEVQQGRSERKSEVYCFRYVEGVSEARTKLEDFYDILR